MTNEEHIEQLKKLRSFHNGSYGRSINKAIEALEQQKKGHWILTDDDFVYCSECEDSYYPRPIDASWYYCPHCGAKMESEMQK